MTEEQPGAETEQPLAAEEVTAEAAVEEHLSRKLPHPHVWQHQCQGQYQQDRSPEGKLAFFRQRQRPARSRPNLL